MAISENNRRIARNSLFLYVRMAIIMVVNLYVVRIVLNELGAEDYGIYSVIAGTVTLFTFLSTSLSSGAQRFFAYDIGTGESDKLKKTFSLTIYVYGIIGLIFVILLETLGVWVLNSRLNIPFCRLWEANCVFQLVILSFLINIFIIPFNAVVIAYERMSFFAYLSIAEALLKLAIAFSLIFISANKLILYSILLCSVSITTLLIYIIYIKNNIKDCSLVKVKKDFSYSKILLKYSGWNMIGVLAGLFRNQGLIILLNVYFNPIVNAAQTIGQQIYGVVNQLISNVYIASRPQITKYHSQRNDINMWRLIFLSGKIAYFLMLIIVIPLFICIDFILHKWLGNVPPYTSIICRLLLISLLIETFTNQLFGGFQATNRLKKVQSISSTILLLNIPVSYLILKFYTVVQLPYLVIIIISILYSCSIIYVARIDLCMSVRMFLRELFIPTFLVLITAPIIPVVVFLSIKEGWSSCVATILSSIVSVFICIWIFGITRCERNKLKTIIKRKLR